VLYEQLAPFAGRHVVGVGEGSIGAVDRYLGLLASTLGRSDHAERHLVEGIRLNEQMGARPWAAHSRHDLATVLRERDRGDDRERADELKREALVTARALGMTALESRIPGAVGARPEEQAPSAADAAGVFRREGDYWTVAFAGDTVRIRDAKGMRHLARLLAEPGRELHALDLARTDAVADRHATDDVPELAPGGLGDAGPRLDAEAKAAYRDRLEELRGEVAEGEAWNDAERAARARVEMEFLADELAGAVGLGGRDRKAGSAAERARLSVTRAIRSALARIAEQHPALGRHLDATVRTGTFCSYTPDPRVPFTWQL
jgi:hypothetical protein